MALQCCARRPIVGMFIAFVVALSLLGLDIYRMDSNEVGHCNETKHPHIPSIYAILILCLLALSCSVRS